MNCKKKFKREAVENLFLDSSYGFENLDCECEAQTINQFTNIGGPDATVVGLNYGEIHNHKQSSATESNYKGRLSISQDLGQERRKKRYEEESLLQAKYYIKRKKETENLQTIYKDNSLKMFYCKPYECKFDNLDRGRDLQLSINSPT
jgi:hypothetical protein